MEEESTGIVLPLLPHLRPRLFRLPPPPHLLFRKLSNSPKMKRTTTMAFIRRRFIFTELHRRSSVRRQADRHLLFPIRNPLAGPMEKTPTFGSTRYTQNVEYICQQFRIGIAFKSGQSAEMAGQRGFSLPLVKDE